MRTPLRRSGGSASASYIKDYTIREPKAQKKRGARKEPRAVGNFTKELYARADLRGGSAVRLFEVEDGGGYPDNRGAAYRHVRVNRRERAESEEYAFVAAKVAAEPSFERPRESHDAEHRREDDGFGS